MGNINKKDVRIMETFDEVYELLKTEFNNGSISVVGSVLNHITGFNAKTDDSGDIDLIMDTQEAELRLIEISKQLSGRSVKITYTPKNPYSKIKLQYDQSLIETFVYDPKKGKYNEILYKGKKYSLYEELYEDQLDEIFNIVIVVGGRLTTSQRIYEDNPNHKTFTDILKNLKRMEKQLKNVDMHIKRAEFDYITLVHYKTYLLVRERYESELGTIIFTNDKGNPTIKDVHSDII